MRRTYALTLLAAGATVAMHAQSLSCSLTSATGSTLSNSCATQSQIFSNDPVNWLTSFGLPTQGPQSGPLQTSNNAVNVTLTSPGLLQLADNSVYAWNGSAWAFPDSVANQNITTFQGQFDAPNSSTGCATVSANCGAYGDEVVGVMGNHALTITFSAPVTSAGFLISSRSLASFQATLQAYDSNNNLLGTYAIVANGLGGVCSGLGVLNPNPTPCNDAPLLAFLGPQTADISKLVVATQDNSGFFVDSLYIEDSAPEPPVMLLVGSGLCVLGLIRRKRRSSR